MKANICLESVTRFFFLKGDFCKNVRLSWLRRSECQMYCWVQCPWVFFVFLGVTLDSAETSFAQTPFLGSRFAILIALYRSHFGPLARSGQKKAENGLWPHREKRGKMAEKMGGWPFLPVFVPMFPFFGHFSPFSQWGPFSAIFLPVSGRRAEMGSVQGNQDRNSR